MWKTEQGGWERRAQRHPWKRRHNNDKSLLLGLVLFRVLAGGPDQRRHISREWNCGVLQVCEEGEAVVWRQLLLTGQGMRVYSIIIFMSQMNILPVVGEKFPFFSLNGRKLPFFANFPFFSEWEKISHLPFFRRMGENFPILGKFFPRRKPFPIKQKKLKAPLYHHPPEGSSMHWLGGGAYKGG
jgi:hypothetical protein